MKNIRDIDYIVQNGKVIIIDNHIRLNKNLNQNGQIQFMKWLK